MFKNLQAEMIRNGITDNEIIKTLGISAKSFNNKMTGRTEFTRKEMFLIKSVHFPDYDLEYLFNEFPLQVQPTTEITDTN